MSVALLASLAATVSFACPITPAEAGAPAYAMDAPAPQPDIVCIVGRQDLGTFDHEMGHVFDYQRMTDAARDRFRSIIGIKREWRSPPNSPHEQFAEAFRMCMTNARQPDRWGAGYDYWPTRRQHRKVCRLIKEAT